MISRLVWQIETRRATLSQILHKCPGCGWEIVEKKEVLNPNYEKELLNP
jgi:hypothetical protein